MTKEMEQLVENLDGILMTYQFKSTRYVPIAGWRHIITCIGEAVLGGEYPELDELLRVLGRSGVMSDIEEWADRMATDGAMDFIAFRERGA